MPMLVDEDGLIIRYTEGKPMWEKPLKRNWMREAINSLWWLVTGGR